MLDFLLITNARVKGKVGSVHGMRKYRGNRDMVPLILNLDTIS